MMAIKHLSPRSKKEVEALIKKRKVELDALTDDIFNFIKSAPDPNVAVSEITLLCADIIVNYTIFNVTKEYHLGFIKDVCSNIQEGSIVYYDQIKNKNSNV